MTPRTIGLASLAIGGVLLAWTCAPPTHPDTTPPAPPAAPATAIALTVDTATSNHESLLNIRVTSATGAGVPDQIVTLTTSSGTVNHPTLATGIQGTAQAMLTTEADATVTARLGSLASSVRAIAFHLPPPPTTTVGTTTSVFVTTITTTSVPPTTSSIPITALTASLTCTAVAAPGATPCNVNVRWGPDVQPATSIVRVSWNWGDGSTQITIPPTAPIATHPYASPGSYTIFVTVDAVRPVPPGGFDQVGASQAVVIP